MKAPPIKSIGIKTPDSQPAILVNNAPQTPPTAFSFKRLPNIAKPGKELMSQDAITVMDGGKCIFQLRGVRPFISDKFDITKHKNYKLLEDYDKRNFFDIQKYLVTREKAKLRKNTEVTRMNIQID